MSNVNKVILWLVIIAASSGTVTAVILLRIARRSTKTLSGAVIARNVDPNKEVPIAGVQITAVDGLPGRDSTSDSLGFFRITVPKWIRRSRPVVLEFRHPGYQQLDLPVTAGNELYVIRMTPNRPETRTKLKRPPVSISNITVRYTVKATTALNVGTRVKPFQVVNTANVPCNGHGPCSPNGKWRAGVGSAVLDAGEGNVFRNVQVSCIAGPCPFTRIDSNGFSDGGRRIMVSAWDWSDTATFLIEADVFHPMVSDDVRVTYPVVFGQTLSFTVPVSGEGVSIEADVNRDAIVFPLGPDLYLIWASCVAPVIQGQTKVFRCEAKPGYRFQ
jgi:hypothetical protein